MARKRRIGDRNDGYRLRTLDPLYNFIPYIMARRSDAWTLFEDQVEITEVDRWLRNTRKNGYKGLGYLHLFIASYVRVVSQRPTVNRFVVGRRIYARNNIEIVMAVRRGMSSEAGETTIKVVFEPTDTVFDVYNKMEAAIGEIKNGEEDNGTEAFARIATKLPRFLLQFAIGLLKLMDYFGLIPASLLAVSPFHGSMIITDLGSLGIGPVYHHIYDFEPCPPSSPSAPSARSQNWRRTARPCSASTSTTRSTPTSASATAMTMRWRSSISRNTSAIPRNWRPRRRRSTTTSIEDRQNKRHRLLSVALFCISRC